jgi:predicted transcriptional regulator of viral defense system
MSSEVAPMKLANFFDKHHVFTVAELSEYLSKRGPRDPWNRKKLLDHHRKQGRIVSVRRGLYAVVPSGTTPEHSPVDPYLVAAKMADDSVLCCHTALEFYGKAYSVYNRFHYFSRSRPVTLRFRSYEFRRVAFPKSLLDVGKETFEVKVAERLGLDVKVTSFERTLVDVLHRPHLVGSWEEIWRSLESIEFFNLNAVVDYALLLGNATTVSKVGFFLEQHRETLMVSDEHLQRLWKHRPQKPHYMVRSERKLGRFIDKWNLVVPLEILTRSWMETL